MCTGRTHALSGTVLGLGVGVVTHMTLKHDAEIAGLTTGMALLLDLDSCGSTGARSLGLISGAVSHLVRKVSGGHRHATHSLIGIAAFTGLALLACHFRGDYAGLAGLALLITLSVSAGLEALHVTRSHVADVTGILVSAAVIYFGWGLALIPLAVLLGCLVHGILDSMTDSGVNWLWPCQYRVHFLPEPFAWSTGSRPETMFVFPVLVVLLAGESILAIHPAAWGMLTAAL
jgi:membrane-bound metal-dependent hydrolase YbcI (DUF457 family)